MQQARSMCRDVETRRKKGAISKRTGPPRISFVRLTDIPTGTLIAHMSDPRVAEHMPLLKDAWTCETAASFVAEKEAFWRRDGLGHWAILAEGSYVGWGGFQKQLDEWDFGLVLTPNAFGLGTRISRAAFAFAKADARIPFITIHLPPTRRNLAALKRMGASFVGEIAQDGATFLKYRLETR